MRERQVFDPESISAALRADLVHGLRAIADAIERKEVDGYFSDCMANGFTPHWDDRMHLRVSFYVAAQIFRIGPARVRLDPPTLELPVPPAKELS